MSQASTPVFNPELLTEANFICCQKVVRGLYGSYEYPSATEDATDFNIWLGHCKTTLERFEQWLREKLKRNTGEVGDMLVEIDFKKTLFPVNWMSELQNPATGDVHNPDDWEMAENSLESAQKELRSVTLATAKQGWNHAVTMVDRKNVRKFQKPFRSGGLH